MERTQKTAQDPRVALTHSVDNLNRVVDLAYKTGVPVQREDKMEEDFQKYGIKRGNWKDGNEGTLITPTASISNGRLATYGSDTSRVSSSVVEPTGTYESGDIFDVSHGEHGGQLDGPASSGSYGRESVPYDRVKVTRPDGKGGTYVGHLGRGKSNQKAATIVTNRASKVVEDAVKQRVHTMSDELR